MEFLRIKDHKRILALAYHAYVSNIHSQILQYKRPSRLLNLHHCFTLLLMSLFPPHEFRVSTSSIGLSFPDKMFEKESLDWVGHDGDTTPMGDTTWTWWNPSDWQFPFPRGGKWHEIIQTQITSNPSLQESVFWKLLTLEVYEVAMFEFKQEKTTWIQKGRYHQLLLSSMVDLLPLIFINVIYVGTAWDSTQDRRIMTSWPQCGWVLVTSETKSRQSIRDPFQSRKKSFTFAAH